MDVFLKISFSIATSRVVKGSSSRTVASAGVILPASSIAFLEMDISSLSRSLHRSSDDGPNIDMLALDVSWLQAENMRHSVVYSVARHDQSRVCSRGVNNFSNLLTRRCDARTCESNAKKQEHAKYADEYAGISGLETTISFANEPRLPSKLTRAFDRNNTACPLIRFTRINTALAPHE